MKVVKRRVSEKLVEQGIIAVRNLVQVQKLAKEQNMAIIKENLPKVKEGGEGKSKGILQVLWERGFINALNLKQYTMDRRKDAYGIHQPNTSLKYLPGSCKDPKNKESLLQSMGRTMGVVVD